MTPHNAAQTVPIGGHQVTVLVAALIAQEADRLGVLPNDVGDVAIPDPAPTHVTIAGYRLTIGTAAAIATAADEQGMHPKRVIESIVEERAEALDRRARTRETRPTLAGEWMYGASPSGRRGGDA